MQMTKIERLTLANQYEILKRQNPEDAEYYDELLQILKSGYASQYDRVFREIQDEFSIGECEFVHDVLTMYRTIEDFKRDNPGDNDVVNHVWGKFCGFDANNEPSHLGYARFLVVTQDRFQELKNADGTCGVVNSHFQTLSQYRSMVSKWRELGMYDARHDRDKILQILNSYRDEYSRSELAMGS